MLNSGGSPRLMMKITFQKDLNCAIQSSLRLSWLPCKYYYRLSIISIISRDSMRSEQSKVSFSRVEKIRQGQKENVGPTSKSFTLTPKPNHKVTTARYPKDISRYTATATLGLGTFGRVQQVVTPNRQVFALKQISKSHIISSKQVQNMKRQKQILSELAHPFIYSLKATFQDSCSLYMLLEYCPGGELFNRLQKEVKLGNEAAVFYISEVVLAICYLHSKSIMYRDLKPQNVLIDREGHIKIADFGFAKKLGNDRTFTLCGTPEYLAPEIVLGEKQGYGRSVDWWSLGILVYELLTGPPFSEPSPLKVYQKILEGNIHFPASVSVEAKDLICKLLQSDAKLRWKTADHGVGIKNHEWFKGLSWRAVLQRKTEAPWTPYLRDNLDVRWFPKIQESSVIESVLLTGQEQTLFNDF